MGVNIKVNSDNIIISKTDNLKAVKPFLFNLFNDRAIINLPNPFRYFIAKSLTGSKLIKPRIVICIPFGITQVEKRAVKESAEQAGAREVYLIEEPMAAAIGAGLPITDPSGNMIVDIGGGTTDIAVVSLKATAF
jgi:rod shape-determining protein MreB